MEGVGPADAVELVVPPEVLGDGDDVAGVGALEDRFGDRLERGSVERAGGEPEGAGGLDVGAEHEQGADDGLLGFGIVRW